MIAICRVCKREETLADSGWDTWLCIGCGFPIKNPKKTIAKTLKISAEAKSAAEALVLHLATQPEYIAQSGKPTLAGVLRWAFWLGIQHLCNGHQPPPFLATEKVSVRIPNSLTEHLSDLAKARPDLNENRTAATRDAIETGVIKLAEFYREEGEA